MMEILEIKKLGTTMYNRNYGGFEYKPNPLWIAKAITKPKLKDINP